MRTSFSVVRVRNGVPFGQDPSCELSTTREQGAVRDRATGTDGLRPVKSAARTLDVLEILAAGARSFGELSRDLGIPKSSLHGILATMEDRGWVEQAPEGRVRLGLRALQVGSAYLEADEAVVRTAGLLDRLAAVTGETVQLARLDGASVVYLAQRASTHPVRLVSAVGSRLPAHATALGKALLAVRDLEGIRRRLSFPLEALTSHTLTHWDQLRVELELIRDRGYAVDQEEALEGLYCFAVTLPGTRPSLDGVSVSVPTFRLSPARERVVLDALREAQDAWSVGRTQRRG